MSREDALWQEEVGSREETLQGPPWWRERENPARGLAGDSCGRGDKGKGTPTSHSAPSLRLRTWGDSSLSQGPETQQMSPRGPLPAPPTPHLPRKERILVSFRAGSSALNDGFWNPAPGENLRVHLSQQASCPLSRAEGLTLRRDRSPPGLRVRGGAGPSTLASCQAGPLPGTPSW